LLANRADGAQHEDFAAHRGIREQARSYPIQVTPVNGYCKVGSLGAGRWRVERTLQSRVL
jgi:hypothetical protein